MELDAIKTALYTWVKRETNLANVIYARQGTPRPALPYATILVTNAAQREGAVDETRQSGQDQFQAGMRTVLVSLNILGPKANQIMASLRDTLDRSDVIEELSVAGLAHVSENGPNDLTALEETEYTERSQLDLTFRYAIEKQTTAGPIETVEITGQAGQIAIQKTVP